MSQSIDDDVTAVLEAIDHYSDGDVDHPQEIMVELRKALPRSTRLSKKSTRRSWSNSRRNWSRCSTG